MHCCGFILMLTSFVSYCFWLMIDNCLNWVCLVETICYQFYVMHIGFLSWSVPALVFFLILEFRCFWLGCFTSFLTVQHFSLHFKLVTNVWVTWYCSPNVYNLFTLIAYRHYVLLSKLHDLTFVQNVYKRQFMCKNVCRGSFVILIKLRHQFVILLQLP